MDHKTFSAYTLKTDPQQGIVESIVSVMGNDDQTDDIIHNGAFTKSIQERRGKIRVLDQHQTDSVMRVVGKPLEMRELSRDQLPAGLLERYPSATGGLYTKTQYLMDTPEGKGVFQRIASGAVDEYSIGYDALDVDYSKIKSADGTDKTVRNLRTIKLYEYSPVIWGANSATQTLSIKGATGAAGLPLADRARAWDATGAEGRVRTWADATDAPNAKYRSAFFWYNSDAPDNFTSYKLQFADVLGGTLMAIPRGIFAVAAVLQGSRGGASIPQADQDAIKSKVSAYYAAMRKKFDDESIVPPWESKSLKEMKPWNVFHEGDKWNVYKVDADGNQTGDALGSHDNEADARAQVRALYANEGKSRKQMSMNVDTGSPESRMLNCILMCHQCLDECSECAACCSMSSNPTAQECEAACRLCAVSCQACVSAALQYGLMSAECAAACQVCKEVCEGCASACLKCAAECWELQSTCLECGNACLDCKTACDMALQPTGAEMSAMSAKAGRIIAGRNMDRLKRIMAEVQALMDDAAMNDSTDNTDNAPAKRAATTRDTRTQAGPSTTTPTDAALRQSLEIEIETLKLLEV